MSRELGMIVMVSSIGLFFCAAWLDFRQRQRRRILSGVLFIVAVAVCAYTFPNGVESKGPVDETIAIVFCYLSMLLGMVAEYGYTQAERGNKRLTFEPMSFFMPIFASPIVFIPLLTITTDVSLGGAFTKAKLMVYLVAFQNGFFWKGFFEQRRKLAAESAQAKVPAWTNSEAMREAPRRIHTA